MAYKCQYTNYEGVKCAAWNREDEQYCDRHQESVKAVDEMWDEVNQTIKKAREK